MMDRPLTEVVRGTFAPYVLVVATQEAHDACLRRGTTPVALFRDSLVPSRGKIDFRILNIETFVKVRCKDQIESINCAILLPDLWKLRTMARPLKHQIAPCTSICSKHLPASLWILLLLYLSSHRPAQRLGIPHSATASSPPFVAPITNTLSSLLPVITTSV